MTYDELIKKYNLAPRCESSITQGWVPLLDRLIADLIALGWDRQLEQIKSKFGGLRFYITNETPEITERIKTAEKEAWETCCVCGDKAAVKKNGETGMIVHVFCDSCNNKYVTIKANDDYKALNKFFRGEV